jgi:hypothetical protein
MSELGITGKLLKVLLNAFTGMETCIMVNGVLSKWIKVKRSVRQGSPLGAWAFLIMINDLGKMLKECIYGANIGQVKCGALLQADDIVILAFHPTGLQQMINICVIYCRLWHFAFNIIKTVVQVFGESTYQSARETQNRKWTMGAEIPIKEVLTHKYLGITRNKFKPNIDRIKESCQKLRGTFAVTIGIGAHPKGLSPLTAAKLYKNIVLPRALYGCELWCNISKPEMNLIERSHRMCIKCIQQFPKRTATVIALSMMGVTSIEGQINRKKLIFLGRLCRLNSKYASKRVFLMRLCTYLWMPGEMKGFIPEITNILSMYQLNSYLEVYLMEAVFPDKKQWKRIIDEAIQIKEVNDRQSLLNMYEQYSRFQSIHIDVYVPHIIWKICHKTKGGMSKCLTFLAKLCTVP